MAFVIQTGFPLSMYVAIHTGKRWVHWGLEYPTDAYFEIKDDADTTMYRTVNQLPAELLEDFDFQKLVPYIEKIWEVK